jgi:hypothetical protein
MVGASCPIWFGLQRFIESPFHHNTILPEEGGHRRAMGAGWVRAPLAMRDPVTEGLSQLVASYIKCTT